MPREAQGVPRISVIVPVYNRKTTLANCLEGLLGQDYPAHEYEVTAIDNNSTDGSAALVRQYSRVTLLHETKQGSYAARNCGLRQAKGEIIAFIDSDCVASRDWLSKIDQAMQDRRLQVVLGSARPVGQSPAIRLLGAYEMHKDRYVFSKRSLEKYYGHTCNMAVRRDAFLALGCFDEWRRGADSVFVQRAVDRFGYDGVCYEPQISVRHLELQRAHTYFKKMYTYGRARRLGNRIVAVKALTTAERLQVFRETAREERLSAIDTAMFLGLLIVGAGCWYAGNFSANAYRSDHPQ